MATAACMIPTDEKADCFRFLALIIDGGTYVLHHRFDQAFPPSDLQNKLNDPQVRGKLNNLRIKKVITNDQWKSLYPPVGQPDSEKFDISLLVCLLRYVCGLDENAQVWKGIPASFDISTEADITRLRQFRNKASHMKELSLTKPAFNKDWNRMEQVILRLGHGIPQLQTYIQKLKTGSLDPSKEKEYENTIKEWEKMDENIRQEIDEIKGSIRDQGTCIEGLEQKHEQSSSLLDNLKKDVSINTAKVSNIETKHDYLDESARRNEEEHRNLFSSIFEANLQMKQLSDIQDQYRTPQEHMCERIISRTKWFIKETSCDQVYTVTNAHYTAKEKLKRLRCLVISGSPGDGKTTMATKLLCETAETEYRIKLNSPKEWIFGLMSHSVIFIDDIFGEGIFRENLLNKWSTVLPEIHKNAASLIITTRHYILEQAKRKMSRKCLSIFENVQELSSSSLSHMEKSSMLTEHLRHAKRNFSKEFVESCIESYNTSAFMGLPEIVRLFSNNEQLFSKGASVFFSPTEFFINCLKDLFRDEYTFLAMILIWSSPQKKVAVIDLEQSWHSLKAANQFGFEINETTIYRREVSSRTVTAVTAVILLLLLAPYSSNSSNTAITAGTL